MATEPESPLRDTALDAAWRAHSREEPPAHLDAAILAAAHRAVAAGPRDIRQVAAGTTGPHRWRMPLAAAAMIGAVVIGVSRLVPPDRVPIAPSVSDIPARDAAPPGNPIPTLPPPADAPPVVFAPSPAEGAPAAALGAVAPSGDAASESERADQASARDSTFAPAQRSQARAAATPPARGMLRAKSNEPNASTPDADAWVARIRKLYAEGKRTEAAKELDALRAAVPDADRRLPPELRAWATTVEP